MITPPLPSLAVTVMFAVPSPTPVSRSVLVFSTVARETPTLSDSARMVSASPSGSEADTVTSFDAPTSTFCSRIGLIVGAWLRPFTVTMKAVLVRPPRLSLAVTVMVAVPAVTPVTRICVGEVT